MALCVNNAVSPDVSPRRGALPPGPSAAIPVFDNIRRRWLLSH
jgi:hypothetical protein